MTFVELDESEGFILLGRRREKDFLSTWALLEGQVLATCGDTSSRVAKFPKHLRRARAVMVTRGRTAAARRRTQLRQGDAASLDALSRGELVWDPASQDAEPTRTQRAL